MGKNKQGGRAGAEAGEAKLSQSFSPATCTCMSNNNSAAPLVPCLEFHAGRRNPAFAGIQSCMMYAYARSPLARAKYRRASFGPCLVPHAGRRKHQKRPATAYATYCTSKQSAHQRISPSILAGTHVRTDMMSAAALMGLPTKKPVPMSTSTSLVDAKRPGTYREPVSGTMISLPAEG